MEKQTINTFKDKISEIISDARMAEKITDHFNRYTNADVVYVSGGELFLSRGAAESHGNGLAHAVHRNQLARLKELSDKIAEAEKRALEQLDNQPAAGESSEAESPTTKTTDDHLPDEGKKESGDLVADDRKMVEQDTDTLTPEHIEAMTYDELKAAAKAAALDLPDNKKETIKVALLAAAEKGGLICHFPE